MNRLSPVLVAGLLAAALASGVATAASAAARGSASASGSFVDLRVCGATTFSREQNRCTHNERLLRITSNRISCSVTLIASEAGTWRVRFTYAGAVEPWTRGGSVTKGSNQLAYNTNIGINLPVPGGKWKCEFAFGNARDATSFTSGGPTGEIVDTAVCHRSDVLSFGSKREQKRCAADDSAKPLPVSQRIYCSAVYAHPASKAAKIEFLKADGTSLSIWNLNISWPTVSQGFGYIDPSASITPGSYVCRFELGDGTTVDKPFQIGQPAG